MKTVMVKTVALITQSRVEDVLCGAFEGGSNYWAVTGVTTEQMEKANATFPFEVATRGGEIKVFDAENPKILLGVINAERIEKALQLMSEGKNEKGEDAPYLARHLNDIIKEDDDACTSDVFLQMAVMGEIVFG